ncbi:MAG TPA: type I-C CRISPR-associated endonuclease Cas1c [Pirellulales bacterium]|nr:type I-C CRISPR-associated endonuclease Cas1c [Pirellulales bacterium]
MRAHANTLFITTQGAYLTRDHQTLRVKIDGKVRLTVPLHHLEGVVCFGRVMVSPAVLATCGEHRLGFSFLSEQGRFLARVEPPIHGNVLLRRRQYRLADDPLARLRLARPMIAAKIQNARNTLLRAARDDAGEDDAAALRTAAAHLAAVLAGLPAVADLDAARGIEGETARTYFGAFSRMVRHERETFALTSRSRRPPRDPINALLSFVYALVRHDCHSALECVGLDPAVGYLHVDRPGRPSLALDLMEEFRTLVADRLVLTLVNRRQVQAGGFSTDAAGGVQMDDKTRRALLVAYQERKREEVMHPLLGEVVPVGLLPHLQARLLARTLRGDLDDYPALVLK